VSVAPVERRPQAVLPRSRFLPKVKWAGRAQRAAACRMRAVQSVVVQLTAAAPPWAPDHVAAGRLAVLLPVVLRAAVAVARTELQA